MFGGASFWPAGRKEMKKTHGGFSVPGHLTSPDLEQNKFVVFNIDFYIDV